MNTLGLVAAVTAFMSIWIGHVMVRKIESISQTIWLPMIIFTTLGLITEYCSLITDNLSLKTALGIIGIILLWDSFEIYRQQKRIIKGHAPANPNNPRHEKILKEYSSATTLDLLKREPTGSPLPVGEGLGVREKS